MIAPHILAADAALAEPIMYEVLRHVTDEEMPAVQAQFLTMPVLHTPDDLWDSAAGLGQTCRRKGITCGSLDLLIVTVALHHDAELITFDRDFQNIARVCNLKVKLLHRPDSCMTSRSYAPPATGFATNSTAAHRAR